METETVMGDRALRFAYETLLGRTLWPLLFGGAAVSALLGRFYDSGWSRSAIGKLAGLPGCRCAEAEKEPAAYRSFNDFFCRKLKAGARPFDPSGELLAAPADGRILVYPACGGDQSIPVKGAHRTLSELCLEQLGGTLYAVAVIRLAPVDYHRFHYPCDCVQESDPVVRNGCYHSVNPVALLKRPDLYVDNTRQITELDAAAFGSFRMLEVGAFGVGSILQTAGRGVHAKMTEKGYFKFGGSTVILIFRSAALTFDADLLEASAQGLETLIRCGDRIAVRNG